MKKVSILIALAAFAFVGCSQKEDLNLTESEMAKDETPGEYVADYEEQVFEATLSDLTKTSSAYEDGVYKIKWNSSDQITIFSASNKTGVKFVIESMSQDGLTANFKKAEGETGLIGEGPYWAAYPYGSATFNGSVLKFTSKELQVYEAGSIPDNANLTAAYTTTTALSFKNVCGAVKFSLTCNEADTQVSNLKLTDPDGGLGGYTEVTMDETGAIASLNPFREAGTSLNLNCDVTLTSQAKDFYAICPVGAFANSLQITVCQSGSNKVFTKTSTSAEGANIIKRATVLEMPAVNCYPFTDPGSESIIFSATNEQLAGTTKTSSEVEESSLVIKWLSTDKIRVFSNTCANGVEFTVSTISEGGKSAKFISNEGSQLGAGPYWAAYPSTGWNFSAGTLTFSNSATQTAASGSIGDGTNPAVAYIAAESLEGSSAAFKNVFGVAAFPVSYGNDINLGSLEVTELSGAGLVGQTAVTMNTSTGEIESSTFTKSTDVITVSVSETIGTTAKTFYVPVPAGSFASCGTYNIKLKAVTSSNHDYFMRSQSDNNRVDRNVARLFQTFTPLRFVKHTSQADGQVTLSPERTILHNGDEVSLTPTVGSQVESCHYTVNTGNYDCDPIPFSVFTPSSLTDPLEFDVASTMNEYGYFRVAITTDCAPDDSNEPYISTNYFFIGPKDSGTGAGFTITNNCYGLQPVYTLLSAYTDKGATLSQSRLRIYQNEAKTDYTDYDCTTNITNGYNSVDLEALATAQITYKGQTYQETASTEEYAFYVNEATTAGTYIHTSPVFSPDCTTVYFVTTDASGNKLTAYDLMNKTVKWTNDVGYKMNYNQSILVDPVSGDVFVTVNDYQEMTTDGTYAGGDGHGHLYYLRRVNKTTGETMWNSVLSESNSFATCPFRSAMAITSDGKYIYVCTPNAHFRPLNASNGSMMTALGGYDAKNIISVEANGNYYLFITFTDNAVQSSGLFQFNPSNGSMTEIDLSEYKAGNYNYPFYGSESVHVSDAGNGQRHIHWYNAIYNSSYSGNLINRNFYTFNADGAGSFVYVGRDEKSTGAASFTWGMTSFGGYLYLTTVWDGNNATVQLWNTGMSSRTYNLTLGESLGNTAMFYTTPVFDNCGNYYLVRSETNKAYVYRGNSSALSLIAQGDATESGYHGCYNVGSFFIVMLSDSHIRVRITDTANGHMRTGRTYWSGYKGDVCATNNINTVYPNLFEPASSSNYMYPYK